MFNLVLFGPPGAGKGTQARKLIDKYGFRHISTGEVIRQEIAKGSPVGRSVEEFISKGQLAPDSLVIGMIADYMEDHKREAGIIFDGFPRTMTQAEEFDKILAGHGMSVDLMVSLDVPDRELVERLMLRGRESGRADDTSEEIIRNRIDIYKSQTEIVSAYYDRQGKYCGVNGVGTVEEIFGRIAACIESAMNGTL